MQEHRFATAEDAKAFLTSGNAYLTLRSLETGTRYTFRVKRARPREDLYFVTTLYGKDNTSSYSYVGILRDGKFELTGKSRYLQGSPQTEAFKWMWDWLQQGVIKDTLEVWHEGRCGACGRKLTVPGSIEKGLGPECQKQQSSRPAKVSY